MNQITKVQQPAGKIKKRQYESLEDLLKTNRDPFLESQDVKPISKVPYSYGVDLFITWFTDGEFLALDDTVILKFKEDLKEKMGFSINTANIYLVAVRKFFTYLEKKGIWPNIAKDIKGYKGFEGHLRQAPETGQVINLLSSVDKSTLKGKRDFAMILTMARTAMRTHSIRNANIEDLERVGTEAILHYLSKGRDQKDKEVILVEEVLRAIDDYLKARGQAKPEDPLFVSHNNGNPGQRLSTRSIRKIIKQYFLKIGIDNPMISAHSLRHYCITDLIENEAPLQQVMETAGHASPQTTMRYYHNKNRFKNAGERFGSPLTPNIGT